MQTLAVKSLERQANKVRIDWIDMAKGWGIICVIIGHMIQGTFIDNWIYSFHMPLFFLISGYVFSTKYNFLEFVKRKVKSILVPYFCLGVVIVLFRNLYSVQGEISLKNIFTHIIRLIIQRRNYSLWYLTVLFIINIALYIIVKLLKTETKIAICVFLISIIGNIYYYFFDNLILPWNADACLIAILFFFAGYFYKNHNEQIDGFMNKKIPTIISIILLFAINIIFNYLTQKISGKGLEMFRCSYGFVPFTYISAFAGIFFIIYVSKLITIKPVKYIGENSLLYFAWHQSIGIPLATDILTKLLNFNLNGNKIITIMYLLLEFSIIIVMMTIFNIIISKTKLKFMLGK